MISETTIYQAVCDKCGKEFPLISTSENFALEYAIADGWHHANGKLLCPGCAKELPGKNKNE